MSIFVLITVTFGPKSYFNLKGQRKAVVLLCKVYPLKKPPSVVFIENVEILVGQKGPGGSGGHVRRGESSLSLDFRERRKQPRLRALKRIFVCAHTCPVSRGSPFLHHPSPTRPFISIGQEKFSRTIEFFQERLSRSTAVVGTLKPWIAVLWAPHVHFEMSSERTLVDLLHFSQLPPQTAR